jgi:hypothetical protein
VASSSAFFSFNKPGTKSVVVVVGREVEAVPGGHHQRVHPGGLSKTGAYRHGKKYIISI